MFFIILIVCILNLLLTGLMLRVLLVRRAAAPAPESVHGMRLAQAALASAKSQKPNAHRLEVLELAQRIFLELDLREDSKPDYTAKQAAHYVHAASVALEAGAKS